MNRVRTGLRIAAAALLFCTTFSLWAGDYFPPRGEWERKVPEALGFDSVRLAHALELAQKEAVTEPSDLAKAITDSFSPREPDFRLYGPTKPRAGSAGLVIRGGYIVGEWGDLERVDMTFSVAKSYLSTMAALALRDGLLTDLHEPAGRLVRDGKFDSEHNRDISWHHLLQQTSDWSGTLWDVPDWADRPEGEDRSQWPNRELHQPGSYFKYNDVRVNLLAYALMQVWREPLPRVLKREIMDPIGASATWRWHGYENSWVTLDGLRMQSVSGGGHFGGGIFINTLDHARFGLLFLRGGEWQGRDILPESWIDALREPSKVRPDYGYMWWLNTGRERLPTAPEDVFLAAGFGGNYIYVDQQNDLLVVLRWVPEVEAVIEAILAALEESWESNMKKAFVCILYMLIPLALQAQPQAGQSELLRQAAVQALIDEVGLRESATASHELPGWAPPQKVLVRIDRPERLAGLQAVAPGVEIVAVSDAEEAVAAAAGAQAVIGFCEQGIFDAAPELHWVQYYASGVERCLAHPGMHSGNRLLTNGQRIGSPALAEHAIAMMLALVRGLDVYHSNQLKHDWERSADLGSGEFMEIEGRTVLVVGLGGIGTQTARRAHGLGMRVIATRGSRREGPDYVEYVGLADETIKLAEQADVVINTAPLTDRTRGMFDAEFFVAMKPTAYFVSVGRGGSTVTGDLMAALKNGDIAGAGLDVTDPEPLPEDHPLWDMPRVIITPHTAGRSDKSRDRLFLLVQENLRRYVAGEAMLSVVDIERGY